ncbi:hypothetical protein DOTSEDRAFT_123822 [Dothistroma septosporum NZE10]|uniref:EDC4-like protein pdc1 beta-propeller domain-containing protein n=1 Tax=Dothistroma septosporum (strain NZE10 / CBS 128990) TaxID=675120 RepID=N1PZB7_DOTSN|nr:hypothetical protein DOTSEDRAFT_123822 [Dothistroma septosporum NZE10]
MADLADLFARVKAQSSEGQQQQQSQPSLWAAQPQQQQQQQCLPPGISSPIFSPPMQTPNPRQSSDILSPGPGHTPDPNRSNTLLNLLKFNGQSGSQQSRSQTSPMANLQNVGGNRPTSMNVAPRLESRSSSYHDPQRPLSAADLVSNLQRQSSAQHALPLAERPEAQRTASGNPQDFLLNLLKKPDSHATSAASVSEPAQVEVKQESDIEALTQDMAQASVEPVRQFGSPAAVASPFEALQPSKTSMFNYRNPFDDLNSSSPLNRDRTPQPEQQAQAVHAMQPKKIEILKHNRDVSSNNNGDSAAPASKSRKLESEDTASMGTAEAKPHQSVSEALEGVGEQVDKQVEQALAEADSKATSREAAPVAGDAINHQREEKKPDTTNDGVDSSWESAEDDRQESAVEVYNFPMKPFVSLQIKAVKPARPVRQDNFMVIAQLKKEFDQIDRCLVTASQTHIVYAQVATKKDNGGFRIIRQDTGDHKQVFRSSGERIFNVQLCSSASDGSDVETVLGTGVNGSVFWTSLGKSRGDLFADDDVEGHGFILPPVQTTEENTSGSPVKTRAKMSSRHTDYFAVARGKQIYIVSAEAAKDQAYGSKDRKVDSEKFFNNHSLKINTGKAGKDFCFSEDDSVIVSLDKNGRFKFWDIRDLTARVLDPTEDKPIELKEPLWTMNAAASGSKPDEKPSVSSIMFLDKERPVVKGVALRYMIIGFKQNHILQLWDLGLGKAVQEIRLPHEKDSDGICSISYHSKTGIVAIGHPTRNSIYFVHLSAPKYNIPSMEQARYISMLARNDAGLPKPESTAIMSGLREFSFAKVGQLRSVDMLRTPVENASERGTVEETLFELYTMHSKGVVGISIKREDLGWDASSKMINGKDGLKEGVIEVLELQQPHKLPVSITQSSNGDNTPKSTSKPASAKKVEPASHPTPSKAEIKKERVHSPAAPTNGLPRMASPEPPNRPLPQVPANPPLVTPDSYSQTAQRAKSPVKASTAGDIAEAAKTMVASPRGSQPSLAVVANADPAELQSMLDRQFGSLYQRIESDKRVTDAASSAKQDALLRLVESALTENVDRSLTSIIAARIEQDVIPILTNVTSQVVDRKIAESLPQQLNASVAAAMKSTLSGTLHKALQDKDVHRTISDVTANAVATKVQAQVSAMLAQDLPNMATQASQKMISDLESRMAQQQLAAEKQRQQDNAKIEELSSIVRTLSTTMQNMATSQSAFQEQILRMQRENKSDAPSRKASPSADAPSPQKEAEDAEVADMTQKLIDGKYEEATIQWISSDRQAEIFDKLFVRVNPNYLQSVPPLVMLTVSAAITSSFDTLVNDRLEWLGRVLNSIDMSDADIRDVAPKIMDVLSQRLQGAYMSISENSPNDPSLRTISQLNRQVNEIRRLAQ